MKKNVLSFILAILVCLVAKAQNQENALAPYAQKLVANLHKTHKDLLFIGLHVNPPTGDTTNVIIASTVVQKVGKQSSPGDMEVINKGVLRLKTKTKDSFYEVCLPIATATHQPLGMVVIQIDFKHAKSIVEALQKGLKIRDDFEKEISSKEALFKAA